MGLCLSAENMSMEGEDLLINLQCPSQNWLLPSQLTCACHRVHENRLVRHERACASNTLNLSFQQDNEICDIIKISPI